MHVNLGLYKQIQNGWFIEGKIILCLQYLVKARRCVQSSIIIWCQFVGSVISVDLNSSVVIQSILMSYSLSFCFIMNPLLCVSWYTTQISKPERCAVLRSKVTGVLFKQTVGVFSGHVEVEPILASSANYIEFYLQC